MLNVNNVPKYAKSRRFWVIREVGEEHWFYGAFDDVTRAFKSAKEVENAFAYRKYRVNLKNTLYFDKICSKLQVVK